MTRSRVADRSDLDSSLLILAAIVVMALLGLALDGNWPKVIRVACAAVGYGSTLRLLVSRSGAAGWVPFVVSGAVAGLISGVLRQEPLPLIVVLVQTVGAALLLGPAHWLALRYHRRVRSTIVS